MENPSYHFALYESGHICYTAKFQSLAVAYDMYSDAVYALDRYAIFETPAPFEDVQCAFLLPDNVVIHNIGRLTFTLSTELEVAA